jgi:cytoskeletal protein RodZ
MLKRKYLILVLFTVIIVSILGVYAVNQYFYPENSLNNHETINNGSNENVNSTGNTSDDNKGFEDTNSNTNDSNTKNSDDSTQNKKNNTNTNTGNTNLDNSKDDQNAPSQKKCPKCEEEEKD